VFFHRLTAFSHGLFHLRLHHFIHLDERRPGAFETFARNLLRRVDAGLAAAVGFDRGVVEQVGRAFAESCIG